jgi:hypothetical protein
MSRKTIKTYSGKFLNLTEIAKNDIRLEDIAQGMANIPIRNGQYPTFISLSERAIDLCKKLQKKYPNASNAMYVHGLLYQASEVYLPDMPTYFKAMSKDYMGVEQEIMDAIFAHFGLDESTYLTEVDAAYEEILALEDALWLNNEVKPLERQRKNAKADYMDLMYKLLQQLKHEKPSK